LEIKHFASDHFICYDGIVIVLLCLSGVLLYQNHSCEGKCIFARSKNVFALISKMFPEIFRQRVEIYICTCT